MIEGDMMKLTHLSIPLFAVTLSVGLFGCSSPPKAEPKVAEPAPTPKPEPVPEPKPEPKPEIKGASLAGAEIKLPGDIEFDVAAASIRKGSKSSDETLNALLKILQDNAVLTKVRVEGHTDSDGTEDKNQKLSEARAQAVVKWLVDKGIDAKRLDAVGCGSKDPLVPNTSTENKQKNRRTEFDIEEIGGKPAPGLTGRCEPNPGRAK
jgi:OmpA-OmpF porin, OOP family